MENGAQGCGILSKNGALENVDLCDHEDLLNNCIETEKQVNSCSLIPRTAETISWYPCTLRNE